VDRFLAKTKRVGECLVWTGAVNSRGYPCYSDNGRSVLAHRWIYAQHHGPIPRVQQVHHRCGERRCVEINHLEALTERAHAREHFPEGAPCRRGHPRVLRPNGRWVCPTCSAAATLGWRQYREALIQAILAHQHAQRSPNSAIDSSEATADV
jgi:HNH endonuclease